MTRRLPSASRGFARSPPSSRWTGQGVSAARRIPDRLARRRDHDRCRCVRPRCQPRRTAARPADERHRAHLLTRDLSGSAGTCCDRTHDAFPRESRRERVEHGHTTIVEVAHVPRRDREPVDECRGGDQRVRLIEPNSSRVAPCAPSAPPSPRAWLERVRSPLRSEPATPGADRVHDDQRDRGGTADRRLASIRTTAAGRTGRGPATRRD